MLLSVLISLFFQDLYLFHKIHALFKHLYFASVSTGLISAFGSCRWGVAAYLWSRAVSWPLLSIGSSPLNLMFYFQRLKWWNCQESTSFWSISTSFLLWPNWFEQQFCWRVRRKNQRVRFTFLPTVFPICRKKISLFSIYSCFIWKFPLLS